MRKLFIVMTIICLFGACDDGSTSGSNSLEDIDWFAIYYPFAGTWNEKDSLESGDIDKFIFIPASEDNTREYTYSYINGSALYSGSCVLTTTMFVLNNFNSNTVVYNVTFADTGVLYLYSAPADILKTFIKEVITP